MATKTQVIEKIAESIQDSPAAQAEIDMLERSTQFRLSDAIREGSQHTSQEYGWGKGDMACAWSAAVASAKARKYV